jgi:hypothetical protein
MIVKAGVLAFPRGGEMPRFIQCLYFEPPSHDEVVWRSAASELWIGVMILIDTAVYALMGDVRDGDTVEGRNAK